MKQDKVMMRIQQLRRNLAAAVIINQSLTNPEVLKASQKLDVAVNAYYRILLRKANKRQKPLA